MTASDDTTTKLWRKNKLCLEVPQNSKIKACEVRIYT